MKILGIETSCDETGVAVVEDGTKVRSSSIASSRELFEQSGGVIPEEAARAQLECMLPALDSALSKADVRLSDIDLIAVTQGPGLLGSLLVGTTTGRILSSMEAKPILGIHHTLGHLSSVWLENASRDTKPEFPCITLSVSGGHTDIWYRTSHTKGELLGRTKDDAAGEAFDKGAAVLGLPYPGGPSIAKAAESGDEHAFSFPLPLRDDPGCDFSYSGLKTALRNVVRDPAPKQLTESKVNDIAASYQLALCQHLADKLCNAIDRYPNVKQVHVVGGVSANVRLNLLLQERINVPVLTPALLTYCTDNAAMIAAAAFYVFSEQGETSEFITSSSLPLEDVVRAA